MPRTRLNSLTAPKGRKAPHVSIVGASWTTSVSCPGCAGPVKELEGFGHPRRLCADPTCDFRFGWVLRPTAEIEKVLPIDVSRGRPKELEVRRVVAVPLDASKAEQWALQRPWPGESEEKMILNRSRRDHKVVSAA